MATEIIGTIAAMIFVIIIIASCCGSDSSGSSAPKRKTTTQKRSTYTPPSTRHDHYSECPSCGAPYYDGYCEECGYPDINQGWLGENY